MGRTRTLIIIAVLLFIALSVAKEPSVKRSILNGIQKASLRFNRGRITAAQEHVRLGGQRFNEGKYAAAADEFTKALEIFPQSPELHCNRGLALMEGGETGAALKDFDQAVKLNPKYDTAFYYRGLCHRKRGETDRAASDISTARELNPGAGYPAAE